MTHLVLIMYSVLIGMFIKQQTNLSAVKRVMRVFLGVMIISFVNICYLAYMYMLLETTEHMRNELF